METKDRDKIRAAAEKFLEQGVMFDPRDRYHYYTQKGTAIHINALLTALDEAEKKKIEKGLANIALVRKIKEAEKEIALLREANGDLALKWANVEDENTRLRDALKASEAELQITCSCCKLFKDCRLPCRLNEIRKANEAALSSDKPKPKQKVAGLCDECTVEVCGRCSSVVTTCDGFTPPQARTQKGGV